MQYIKHFTLVIFIVLFSSCAEANTKQKVKISLNKEANFIQQKITNNLYILKSPNYNTNVGVFIGDTDVLLIDPMTGSNNHQNLLNTIKELSDKPINMY